MPVLYKTNVEEAISNKPNAVTAFNLAAAATQADGLRNVLAAYADTNQLPYFVSDGAGLWEDGIGTVTGTTLVRSVINESSNSGSAVDFSAGGALTLIVALGATTTKDLADAAIISNDLSNSGCLIVSDGVNFQTITDGTWNVVNNSELASILYNINGIWSADAQGKITLPVGRWQIGATIVINGVTPSQRVLVGIAKNGEVTPSRLLGRLGYPASSTILGVSGQSIFTSNGTDYFQVVVFVDGTGTHSLASTLGFCSLFAEYRGMVL